MQIILLKLLPRVRWTNGDQGVHNYVLHSGLLPQAKVLENFERVATLHHVRGEQLHVDADGHVVNPDGSISEIVHQYDRHAHLFSAIQEFIQSVSKLKFCSSPGHTSFDRTTDWFLFISRLLYW